MLGITYVAGERTSSEPIDENLFRAYIGPRADYYLAQFRKFFLIPGGQFTVTWHWPAFAFGFWWFLYRKMYLWALVFFFLSNILGSLIFFHGPIGILIVHIGYGVLANYLYFRHVRTKVAEAAMNIPDREKLIAYLARTGGTNSWVVWLGVALAGLLLLGILLSALGIVKVFYPWLLDFHHHRYRGPWI
ncbi:DUF2628 domain-containing protein [Thermosulfuriphilus sp.]